MTSLPAEPASDLDRWLGSGTWSARQIAGDASVRVYFRVLRSDQSFILTYYPEPVREGLDRFVRASEVLRRSVRVPRIHETSRSSVLQEDVGEMSLTSLLGVDREDALSRYAESVDSICALDDARDEAGSINPAFDKQKFVEELSMTEEFYVKELAGRGFGELGEMFETLAENLTHHPYTLCHRDYHGQNLYIFNNLLYVIDYQDLRMGPDSYDLASLLRDRGVWQHLGPEFESSMVERRAEALGIDAGSFRGRFYESLLQRSIKAIGTFARLVVVYERRQYLEYIDPTLETVRECALRLDDWRDLSSIFPFEFKTP